MGLYVVGVQGFFKFICIILDSDANSNILDFLHNSCAFLSMLLFLAKVVELIFFFLIRNLRSWNLTRHKMQFLLLTIYK